MRHLNYKKCNNNNKQADKTKRKKCRGSRKKQRYRRQLYDHGKTSEEVQQLVRDKFHSQIYSNITSVTVQNEHCID